MYCTDNLGRRKEFILIFYSSIQRVTYTNFMVNYTRRFILPNAFINTELQIKCKALHDEGLN